MLTKLTKSQEKKVPVYLDKWLKIGRRTKPIDRKKAKAAIDFIYENILKIKKPKYVIYLDSPMAIQLTSHLIKNTKWDAKVVTGTQIYSQLYSQLSTQLDSQLDSQLSTQLDSQLDSQLSTQLESQLDSQLDSQLRSQLRSQLDSQLYSQLDSQLDSQLRSQLDSQLSTQLESQKIPYTGFTFSNWWYYTFCYYGFYEYVLNELFPKKRKDFGLFTEYTKHIQELHYVTAFNEIAFLSDFPKELHLNDRGQLHHPKGAALLYNDTYALYALNGIRVSKEIAEVAPEKVTREMITKETNADIRREIIRKVGSEGLLKLLDYKTLDALDEYELITFDVGDGRVRPHLKMTCPSTKLTHIEGVRPEIKSVKEALAFKFNQKEWKRPLLES